MPLPRQGLDTRLVQRADDQIRRMACCRLIGREAVGGRAVEQLHAEVRLVAGRVEKTVDQRLAGIAQWPRRRHDDCDAPGAHGPARAGIWLDRSRWQIDLQCAEYRVTRGMIGVAMRPGFQRMAQLPL